MTFTNAWVAEHRTRGSMLPDAIDGLTPQDYGFPENPTVQQMKTWQRQEAFLEAFAKYGDVGAACIETGIPVHTQESWDYRDVHGFKRRKQEAKALAVGFHVHELHRRIHEGYDTPVIHDGTIAAWYKKKDPKDLYFGLKKLDPEYRDNYVPQTYNDNRKLTIVYNVPDGGAQPPANPYAKAAHVASPEAKALPPGKA